MPDDVQPAGGSPEGTPDAAQGGEGGQGLFDLETVSPELREHLEPHLRAISSNVDKKFREAADYRRTWEPFEQLGVKDMDPEALSELLTWAQMDDDQFSKWFEQVGQEAGLFEQLGYGKGDDGELGLGDGLDGLTPEQVQQMVAEAVAENMQPVQSQLAQQEQERLEAETWQELDGRLSALIQEHKLPEEAREDILRLAYSFAEEDDPIGSGFQAYQGLVSKGGQDVFNSKVNQPSAPEGPGAAATSPEKITSFEDAKAAATERLKQSLAT